MKQLILLLFAAILFTPLLGRHRHKKKQNKSSTVLSVSMQRTGCYGRCPGYSVQLQADGAVVYTGLRFVPDTGIYTKKVQPDVIAPVIEDVINYSIDTCHNFYRTRVPDLPGFFLTIVYRDSTKKIMNADSGPYFLKQIANEIDNIGKKTDNAGWEKK